MTTNQDKPPRQGKRLLSDSVSPQADPLAAAIETGDIAGGALTGTYPNPTLAADAVDAITEIAAALKTGADTQVVTGTAGTSGDLAEWNADGDVVDGPTPPTGAIVGTTDSQTLSSKTLTAPVVNTSLTGTAVGSGATQVAAGNHTHTTDPAQATQAALEAETNEDTYAPPDLIKHSPGVAKAWAKVSATPALDASYNVTSVTSEATGHERITIATDFSTADYSIVATPLGGGAGDGTMIIYIDDSAGDVQTAGEFEVLTYNLSALVDAGFFFACFGDQ